MMFYCSDSYCHIAEYFSKKLGVDNNKKLENIVDMAVKILVKYYDLLEDPNAKPDQVCIFKHSTLDSIFQEFGIARVYTEYVEAAAALFTRDEPDEDVNYFIKWLKERVEDNHNIVKEANNYAAAEIRKIIEYLSVTSKNIGFAYNDELNSAMAELLKLWENRPKYIYTKLNGEY